MEERKITIRHRTRVFQNKARIGKRMVPVAYLERGQEIKATDLPEPIFYADKEHRAVSFSFEGETYYLITDEIETMPECVRYSW